MVAFKKTIAINQPFFLPYLPYFKLISSVDTFVIFDSVQFTRGRWANRNRIPNRSTRGWFFFGFPTKRKSLQSKYYETEIAYGTSWQKKLRHTLEQHYGRAPFYRDALKLLGPVWPTGGNPTHLVDLNETLLEKVSHYLGYDVNWVRSSSLERDFANISSLSGKDRVFEICHSLGATSYHNLPGGVELYTNEEFRNKDLDIRFVSPMDLDLIKSKFPKASEFSILDIIMWHSPAEVREILDMIELVEGQN